MGKDDDDDWMTGEENEKQDEISSSFSSLLFSSLLFSFLLFSFIFSSFVLFSLSTFLLRRRGRLKGGGCVGN